MEGRGPYRIYDPGGSTPPGEASEALVRLVEENSQLKEKMQGIKMLGKEHLLPSWLPLLQSVVGEHGWHLPLYPLAGGPAS